MSKELWFQAYEALLEEGCTHEEASEKANDRMVNDLYSRADALRDQMRNDDGASK